MGKLSFNGNKSNNMIKIFFIISLLLALGFGQNSKTPQMFGAHVVNVNEVKLLHKLDPISLQKEFTTENMNMVKGQKTGLTFKAIPFDEERGIDKFTKQSANRYLKRNLFKAPEYTATYYYSKYDKNSLIIENTYIQFVSDSRWNRILYGSLNGDLKSYDNIKNPGEIVVNSAGRVFVAEKAKSRIQVLQVNGKNDNINLEFLYTIDNLGEISSIAYNDGGTPFNVKDDFLFSADAAKNIINKIQISENSAQIVKKFKGIKWPVAITFGRWNGANTNEFYVIDTYAKKFSLYEIDQENIFKISEVNAEYAQTFTAVETDHFGQVYLADGVNGEIFKYTNRLNLLDSQKAQDYGINDINIPFGTINLNDEKHWVGFDQVFVIQKWNDESGVQRYKLGVALNSFDVSVSENSETLTADYSLTEFSNSSLKVIDTKGDILFETGKTTIPSGENNVIWNRRNKNNEQVAPGDYSLKLELESVYDQTIISKETNFYLPMYYHIDCGNEDATKAIVKMSGSANNYNGQTIVESADKIEYKISGLDKNSEYKLSAKFLKLDSDNNSLEIWIDGLLIDQPFEISKEEVSTPFMEIPREAIGDGEIQIQVRNAGAGKVNVADIWLTETGHEFSLSDSQEEKPTSYKLAQNYPNPFNPETKINYQLTENSNVVLKVYDIAGREIETLVNNHQNAGRYSVTFSGANLASGVYFYRLETARYTQSRKMVLLK